MPNKRPFTAITKSFFEHDPVAAARSMEALDEGDAVKILKSLPLEVLVNVFKYIQNEHAVALFQKANQDIAKSLMLKVEPQYLTPVLLKLPEDIRENLLSFIPERKKDLVREIITFPEESAGRIMRTDFLTVRSEIKVKDAILKIRTWARKKAPASYVYVVDAKGCIQGVVNMRDLMLAPGNTIIDNVMHKDVFTIDSFMDREEVANLLSDRHYFAAPVVDAQNTLIGIIRTEDLLVDVQEEAREDIQKMFGAGGDEKPFSPVMFSLRKRMPWLQVNLATAFLASFVVAAFEDVIARITILAVFLPVIAGQGGNAGAQSLAVVMRGLVMREIPQASAMKIIMKESLLGLLNGVLIGLVTGLAAWLWKGNVFLGLVVGLAMIINLVVAGLSGAAIPILMKKFGFDPAQSSNIILTTVTDVVGFFAFLSIASIFARFLI